MAKCRVRTCVFWICLIGSVAPVAAQEPTAASQVQQPPKALNLLHVSFASLEALDVYTTVRGTSRGAVEINPLMTSVASHPIAMSAVKAGVAASSIVLTRRLARDHRVAAIVLTAALNSAYATIAVHNLRVTHR